MVLQKCIKTLQKMNLQNLSIQIKNHQVQFLYDVGLIFSSFLKTLLK